MKLNHHTTKTSMQKGLVFGAFLVSFLLLLSVSFPPVLSQEYSDTVPTLNVSLRDESIFIYQDSEGYSVVAGIVENNNLLTSITGVELRVAFYNDHDPKPIQVIQGTSILEVIPAGGKSPFAIRSDDIHPGITQASVSLLGFDPSASKQKGLLISSDSYSAKITLNSTLQFSGTLQNAGAPISDTNVYFAFYDAFEPPRILGVSTINIGYMTPDQKVDFMFDETVDANAVGFFLFSESNVFYSDFVDIRILPTSEVSFQAPTKLVTISDVSVTDGMGDKLSEIPVDSTVHITGKTIIEYGDESESSSETPYTFYVQIKESTSSPTVEYIGKSDGRFVDTGVQTRTIDWMPQKSGLFFIETFVWDRGNLSISEKGPFVLIVVVE